MHLANAHVTPLCVTLIDNQIPYNRLANDVIEVLYFLRSQAESRYVPCILITTEQHRLQDGFRAGANSALVIDPHDYELGTLLLQIDHFWRNLVRTPSR